MSKKSDVIIIGTGFVGLWASVVLSQQGLSVTIVDKNPLKDMSFSGPSNVFSLTDSVYLSLLRHGVDVPASPVRIMRVGTVENFPSLSWGDYGSFRPLAWTVKSDDLWTSLLNKVRTSDRIAQSVFSPSRCFISRESIKLVDDYGLSAEADVSLAADGSYSWLRRYLGVCCLRNNQFLPAKTAVFSIKWAGQDLFTANQWFGDDFGVIAFLPSAVPEEATVVWSLPANHFIWQEDNPSWSEYICHFLNIDPSSLIVSGDVCCYDIEEYTTPMVSQRSIFLGNAASSIHPLAGQALNTGFRCVLRLSEMWKNRPSFRPLYDPVILRAYARQSELEVRKWSLITRSVWYASSNRFSLSAFSCVLSMTDRLVFVKNWLTRCAQ
ncbi:MULTISPECIES: FAD-dependent monooxygenase [Candidatus Ichthyocystis]|uniref:Putative FAD dependent oxidoreductase n=1 Tax=Candidatus Ichthyocystis hellenicum TaxID=1561003 RepID=A0A0S4LZM3_9BURK|nr:MULTISPECIES: FAD-dependent monooxygenase [Ichthyocystis]CUT16942.1 putative FAD dependent oxidoreductase [Candidatus Ichthyocystis hellenicum]